MGFWILGSQGSVGALQKVDVLLRDVNKNIVSELRPILHLKL